MSVYERDCTCSTSQQRRWKETKGEREEEKEGERGKLRKKGRKERVARVSCSFPCSMP